MGCLSGAGGRFAGRNGINSVNSDMIKKQIYGNTLKEQLLASARDRMIRFSMSDGTVRGVVLNGTRLVNEMRTNHELGILETLVLGRAYLGALLMASQLKGGDRLQLQIDCSGPIKGLLVEANAFGEVRGYLKQVPIPVETPLDSFDLAPFFGAGFLSVTHFLENAKQPFTGQVVLEYGNLAKDLANYHLISEQIPSAFNLSIQYDRQGVVVGAGGLLIQAMPGVDDAVIDGLEDKVRHFPPLGQAFREHREVEKIVTDAFESYSPRILANRRVEFLCHCNKARVRNILAMLPIEELEDILENGPFPLESLCHHCNTTYHFDRQEIQQIYGFRYPKN